MTGIIEKLYAFRNAVERTARYLPSSAYVTADGLVAASVYMNRETRDALVLTLSPSMRGIVSQASTASEGRLKAYGLAIRIDEDLADGELRLELTMAEGKL